MKINPFIYKINEGVALLIGGYMEIKKGYVYHIKDEYFDVVQDPTLMRNHENRKSETYIFLHKE